MDLDRPAQRPTKTETEGWYGYQILLVDVGSLALAYSTSGVSLLGTGLSGPMIHWAHGHPRRALRSMLMRVGMAGAGTLIGTVVINVLLERGEAECIRRGDDECGDGREFASLLWGLAGFGVGIIGASVLDSAVLAWDDPPSPKPAPTGLRVAPSFAVVEGGGTLGVVGMF